MEIISLKQVATLQAEAQRAYILKAEMELRKMATGHEDISPDHFNVRITFQQLLGFMEDQIRKGLKQVSQVWVQVSVNKAEMAKLRSKTEGIDSGDADISAVITNASQVTYLKKHLDHEEIKTRLENNSKVLGELRTKLERERRAALRLDDENKRVKKYLEDLKRVAAFLKADIRKQETASARIQKHLQHDDSKTVRKIKTLRKGKEQVMTVEQYLKLNAEVDRLDHEVQRWRKKSQCLTC
ncbi:uncharacterized protein [Palaemon carinicauda]|uniref:uncharacterized protein n=1 Tax=Palaemon carinicauda TaxID=392227 RepID=UPI0035B62B62